MRSLVFDTETTGKAFKDRSIKDKCQPGLVQLGFMIMCSKKGLIARYSSIVDPGKPCGKEAEGVHGITTEMIEMYGVPLKVAVGLFHFHLKKVDRLVAHNMAFDLFVMQCNYYTVDRSDGELIQKSTMCTMLEAMPIVKIPNTNPRYKKKQPYKWPSLDESYKHLVDSRGFTGAHDAFNDVRATTKLMLKLDKRKQ